ncbi:hypothetical protein G5V65_18320 [Rhodobacter sp. HX-7-19]|uniref:Nuclear transport factor 2 family protein n=1 Tax=Paragemmobacter kunshanensis TaxID=2583234 RepID=A0A6M1UB90_9RHOB|nr:nuclear transport factor 2 family protein [Rhodobacter kunshanensis]NGQ92851.1 hypothetical protein [Rhodobacter kunshanensis]
MTTGPTEIIGSADCGNSPKNAFVQDIAIALETGVASVEIFDPEITWARTSTKTLEGQAGVLQALSSTPQVIRVVVQHAISHGKIGAANGDTLLANGVKRPFCHVFEFTNGKARSVVSITTYR